MNSKLSNALTGMLTGLLIGLMLAGCSGVSDTRPEVVRKSEYYLEHGVTAFGNSDYAAASDFFHKALAHYRSIDDTHGTLLSLINLAETAMATGNSQAALQHIEQAGKVSLRNGAPHYRQRLQLMRAQVLWRERRHEQVESLLQSLLPEFDHEDRPQTTPDLLQLSAVILRTDMAFSKIEQQPLQAEQWLRRLQSTVARNRDATPLHDARLGRFEAALLQRQGRYSRAEEKLQEALTLYRSAAHRPAISATLSEIARLQMAQQQWEMARDTLQRALFVRLWMMDRIGSREVLYLLDAVYTELGDEEMALQARRQAESVNAGESAIELLQQELRP